MTGKNASNAVYSLQLSVPRDVVRNEESLASEDILSTAPMIELKDASFSCPARSTQPVLRELNIKLEKGQFVALVGSLGCGKSTVLGLLERLNDLNGGQLLLNGIEVSKHSRDHIRNQLALLSQDLFYSKVQSARTFSLVQQKHPPDDDLDQVAKQAQMYDFIQPLPEGYSTQVGSRETALSGGQKQRIAISRAIAMNKDILFLDEATVALDIESESFVFEALKEAGKSESIIAIVEYADVIYVLNDGRAQESGIHAEFVAEGAVFRYMCILRNGCEGVRNILPYNGKIFG